MSQLKSRSRPAGGEAGYTLVGLLVAVAVVNIALAVVVTSWRTVDTRAREAELIWRGEQIARAIACHGATEATEPLENLEQLVESNCLRRLYGDPMTRDGKWRILRQIDLTDGTIAALQGQPLLQLDGTTATATSGAMGALGSAAAPESSASPGARSGVPAISLDRPSLQGGLSSGASAGGVGSSNTIIGVMSATQGPATRLYRTYDKYESWLFLGVQGGA